MFFIGRRVNSTAILQNFEELEIGSSSVTFVIEFGNPFNPKLSE